VWFAFSLSPSYAIEEDGSADQGGSPGSALTDAPEADQPYGFDESELKEDEESELHENSAYGYGFEQRVPRQPKVPVLGEPIAAGTSVQVPTPSAEASTTLPESMTIADRVRVETKFLRSLSRKNSIVLDEDLDEC
jgi:hypothetical protein